MKRFQRVGMIARWKPVHRGHAPVLRGLCDQAEQALVGIGSANRYNLRNPFTVEESREMIERVLEGRTNLRVIPVPDLDDGPRWRALVRELFGPLDLFVTDNPYVTQLLARDYRILPPVELVAKEERLPIDATLVRREMSRGDGWRALVPEAVAEYITASGLDQRFRREFGLQTLALDAPH